MPRGSASPKPKRLNVSCSLPPELAAKLHEEADARLLNSSLLIERALVAFLPTLPALNGAPTLELADPE